MARIPIEMPKLGYDMETGKVGGWLKHVGDTIARGDVIAEIETDKSTVEMEATASGTLVGDRPRGRCRGPGGGADRLSRGRRVGVRDRGRRVGDRAPSRHAERDAPRDRPADDRKQGRSPAFLRGRPRSRWTPLLDLSAAANGIVAQETRVTVTAFLLRAVALTLVEHPAFNAAWAGDTLERWDAINIGVAIALDDGLIAPALLDCRDRDVVDLARGLADLVARTRAGKLRAPEIGEGTFTVSNLGMYDVTAFTAIITPPQVAILATARAVERAAFRDGEIVARKVMTATLSSDHRALDGVAAARFLGTLKGMIEAPEAWAEVRA